MADDPHAIVVLPALDEEAYIGACLGAIAAQDSGEPFAVIVVDDGSRDATVAVARATAREAGLALEVVPGPRRGPGPARQAGLDRAARRLIAAGRPDGLVASTDADTRVAADWLRRQALLLRSGVDAVGGWIELDPDEAGLLEEAVLTRRALRAGQRLEIVRRSDPAAEHHHFAGASIGLRASTYAALGCELPTDLEDVALAEALLAAGARVMRSRSIGVVTSARRVGRAQRGLAADLRQASA